MQHENNQGQPLRFHHQNQNTVEQSKLFRIKKNTGISAQKTVDIHAGLSTEP